MVKGKGDIVYSTKQTLYDPDMWTIISAFVKKYRTPTGYDGIYHVFIKQGTDVCDHTANSLYSGPLCSRYQSLGFLR